MTTKKEKKTKKRNATSRNQAYIEDRTAERTGVHRDTVKTVFDAFWDTICDELEQGNIVKMHGKGTFYLSKRSSRIGRNPETGKEYDIPEREAMAFQTSPAYAKKLRVIRANATKQDSDDNKDGQNYEGERHEPIDLNSDDTE